MNDGQSRISIELLVLLIIQLGSCVVVDVFYTEVQRQAGIAQICLRDLCMILFLLQMVRC
jgi:hypothetical protein